MSLRAVWVIAPGGDLLFSRRFPTVERRAQQLYARHGAADNARASPYVPLPADLDIASQVLAACAGQQPNGDPVGCDRPHEPPVLHLASSSLWPVVAVSFSADPRASTESNAYHFVALPLVEAAVGPRALRDIPTVQLTGVTAALSVAEQMCSLVRGLQASSKTAQTVVPELYKYIGTAMPFGTPLTVEHSVALAALTAKAPSKQGHEMPAWKPVLYKGRQVLHLAVQERVSVVQYDREETPDVVAVFGTIICKAEVEGVPDVTVSMSSVSALDGILTHGCVKSADAEVAMPRRKLCFSPPLEPFDLCEYQVATGEELVVPIRAFYQMREMAADCVKLLVQLKLHETFQNQFEFCTLRLPFFNRGVVASIEGSPTNGSLSVAKGRQELVWKIGTRFPKKSLEVALPATVYFEPGLEQIKDPFCRGQNAYAQLDFQAMGHSMTGLTIDPTLGVYPQAKIKVQTAKEVVAENYIIWNSLGNVRSCPSPGH